MNIDPNEPVHPNDGETLVDLNTGHKQTIGKCHGLTIRAHFAAMAMQGMVSSPQLKDVIEIADDPCASVARDAIRFADALIAELNK